MACLIVVVVHFICRLLHCSLTRCYGSVARLSWIESVSERASRALISVLAIRVDGSAQYSRGQRRGTVMPPKVEQISRLTFRSRQEGVGQVSRQLIKIKGL